MSASSLAALGGTGWQGLAARQAGVVARRQLIELGLPKGFGYGKVRSGHWRVLMPGIYLTFTGPAPPMSRIWALVLHCGPGAVVGGEAALWLAGGRDQPPRVVQVCVPHGARPVARPNLVVRGHRRLDTLSHPAAEPPRLRVEEAVLDVASGCEDPAGIVDVVLRALQRRITTPQRLADRLAARSRHRWRGLIREVLADALDGTQSGLERRYLRSVERAHGLPRASGTCANRSPAAAAAATGTCGTCSGVW